MSADIYLGLGANLGDPLATFNKSLSSIQKYAKLVSCSKLYRSAPFGFLDQPPFHNAAVRMSTDLSPLNLLKKLQETEKSLGKKVIRENGPRIIDLDLLLYDEITMKQDELTLPHPRILDRDFVLRPLLDLNPKISHPAWCDNTAKSALCGLRDKFILGEPNPWVQP